MQPFLDPKLPKTEEKLQKALEKTRTQLSKSRSGVEQMYKARLAKNQDKRTRKEDKARAKVAELEAYLERLLEQEKGLNAGTRVVSRLEATGRARQLMSDEEHELGTHATLAAHPVRQLLQQIITEKRASLLAQQHVKSSHEHTCGRHL